MHVNEVSKRVRFDFDEIVRRGLVESQSEPKGRIDFRPRVCRELTGEADVPSSPGYARSIKLSWTSSSGREGDAIPRVARSSKFFFSLSSGCMAFLPFSDTASARVNSWGNRRSMESRGS
jgi:hypothetical protein